MVHCVCCSSGTAVENGYHTAAVLNHPEIALAHARGRVPAADQGDPVRLLQQGAVAPLVLWIPAGFLPGTGEDSAQGNGLAAVPPVQHQAGGQHIHPQRHTGEEQPGAVLYRLADGLVQRLSLIHI